MTFFLSVLFICLSVFCLYLHSPLFSLCISPLSPSSPSAPSLRLSLSVMFYLSPTICLSLSLSFSRPQSVYPPSLSPSLSLSLSPSLSLPHSLLLPLSLSLPHSLSPSLPLSLSIYIPLSLSIYHPGVLVDPPDRGEPRYVRDVGAVGETRRYLPGRSGDGVRQDPPGCWRHLHDPYRYRLRPLSDGEF